MRRLFLKRAPFLFGFGLFLSCSRNAIGREGEWPGLPYEIFLPSQARPGFVWNQWGEDFEGTAGHPEGFGHPGMGYCLRKEAVSLFFMSDVSPLSFGALYT